MPFTLTVEKNADGGGTVVSSPTGIDCGATCSAPFADGLTVTLTARPDGSSRLGAWGEGGSSCTGDTCTVSIHDATKVSVAFNKIPEFDLVVTKVGDGDGTIKSQPGLLDCGAKCDDKFREGTVVTLTATAGTKSFFSSWGGACQPFGNNSMCTVTMDSLKAVTATFTKIPDYSVAVTLSGMGVVTSDPTGIDCPGSCIEAFTQGTMVTLTATPASGWRWVRWTGAPSCGSSTTCTLSVDGARSVTAEFMQIPSYKLTVGLAGDGVGSVTSTDGRINCGSGVGCMATYQEGSMVTLTATPTSGTQTEFKGWGGAAAGCAKILTCTLTIDAEKDVTATFMLMPLLTVALSGDGTGSVTSQPPGIDCPSGTCTARFATGTQVKLTTAHDSTAAFTGWFGDMGCGVDSACTVSMTSTLQIAARFSKAGTTLWLSQVGGSEQERGKTLAVDSAGNVYVAGTFSTPELTVGTQLLTNHGSVDVFLVKLSRDDGRALWARAVGGVQSDDVFAIAVDGVSNDVIIFAKYIGAADFGGPISLPGDSGGDFVLARYHGDNGEYVWSRRIEVGTVYETVACGLAIGASGEVFVAGHWNGTIDLGDGNHDALGPLDLFVAKYSSDGQTLLWKTLHGATSAFTRPWAIAADPSGNVVVVGSFVGNVSFGGPSRSSRTTSSDGFVAKYNGNNGTWIWDREVGGTDSDECIAVATNSLSDVAVACHSDVGINGTTTVDYGGGALAGSPFATGLEPVVAQYSSSNEYKWARRLGGPGSQIINGLGFDDATGRVFAGGFFNGSITIGSLTLNEVGQYGNAWTAALSQNDGSNVWAERFGGVSTSSTQGVAADPLTSRIIVTGGFDVLTQFGDKELTAVGQSDGFVASIIPKP